MRLGLRPLLRTTTFRVALGQAAVILVFVVGVLAYLYIATVGQVVQEVDRAVDAEYAAVEQAFIEGGERRVTTLVIERSTQDGPGLYVFSNSDGSPIAGDFSALPVNPGPTPQRIDFGFERSPEDATPDRGQARGKIGRLLSGQVVLVARDLGDGARVTDRITNAFWFILLIGLTMSLAGGLVAARQAARRADALSDVAQRVMGGDLSARAKIRGLGDEYDILAENLNQMLTRLERLVHNVRTAGDAIAHDLRSPLIRLRQRLEGALEAVGEPGADRDALRKAHEEAEGLLTLIASVLKLARLESADSWDFAPVEVSHLAEELAEFYRPAAEEEGLSFTLAVEPGLGVVGDASLITQALSNLIENAVKYTPVGGRVAVTVARGSAGWVELAVADDGPGIPVADRPRVLERFVRLEQARTSPGAGLGLSLVAAVAKLHKGEIALEDGIGPAGRPGLTARLRLPEQPT